MTHWSVYIILCSDGSLYTGITTDINRRFQQHATQKGAKYFRHCQPERIVFIENGHTCSSASRREAAIKKLTRENKQKLLAETLYDFKNIEKGLLQI
jgi:putative endonuclease